MLEVLQLFFLVSLTYTVLCGIRFVVERKTRSLTARDSGIAAIIHGLLSLGAVYVPALPALATIVGQALTALGSVLALPWATKAGSWLANPLSRTT